MTTSKYVSEKLFAKPSVCANELINRLTLSSKYHMERLTDFFEKIVKVVILEMTDEQRIRFIYFCTGYNYLPHHHEIRNAPFNIKIKFSSPFEMTSESLPIAYTKDCLLKLPWNMYDCNKEMFKLKLFQSMNFVDDFSIK